MNIKSVVFLIVALIIVGAAGYVGYRFFFASPEVAVNEQGTQTDTTAPQVEGQEVKVGAGKEATPGTVVTVDYVGKLADGTVFDSSVGKQPLTFTLGAPGIIPGFQIGVNGMKEGGERIISIPPELGYGSQQAGSIPPNSTLVFGVKLIKVEAAPSTKAQ